MDSCTLRTELMSCRAFLLCQLSLDPRSVPAAHVTAATGIVTSDGHKVCHHPARPEVTTGAEVNSQTWSRQWK